MDPIDDKYSWVRPFCRQAFVTTGVILNMMAHGTVAAYGAILLPQLRTSEEIPIDDESGSWIASIIGTSLLIGGLITSAIMKCCGRKTINILAAVIITVGWLCIIMASSVITLLLARFLQGLALGFTAFAGPMLIAEYTSPKYRGQFLATVTFSMLLGILLVHAIGSYIHWRTTAVLSAGVAFIDLVIIVFSPESPSFLAMQGRYEECRRVYHWLRGPYEDEELDKMIKTDIVDKDIPGHNKSNFSDWLRNKIDDVKATVVKKEFYKPVIIMAHVFSINLWSGSAVLDIYTTDVYQKIIGDNTNIPLLIMSADIQRVVANGVAIFVIGKIRRRVMLFTIGSLNVIIVLLTAGYSFCKSHGILPFDDPIIGILLIHLHMFTIATGTTMLPNILIAEVFPLKYKGEGGMIALTVLSLNYTINLKTTPYMFSTIGLHGQYIISACVVAYCLAVAWVMLPETKDRPLQEIEESYNERRGLNEKESLSLKAQFRDPEKNDCFLT